MRLSYKTIVVLVVAAFVALAAGYACGDDAPPAVDRTTGFPPSRE